MHAFLVSIEVTDLDLVVTVPLHRDTEMRVTCPSSQCDKEYLPNLGGGAAFEELDVQYLESMEDLDDS